MHILSALLLGISTNLDNLLIGLSFGLQRKKIPPLANGAIGLLSAAITCLFCYLSSLLAVFGRIPNLIGSILIILIGLYAFLPPKKEAADPHPTRFTWKETAALGCCLAVNCIPVAFGAGLTGISPLAASLSVGIISFLVVGIGNAVGLKVSSLKLNSRLPNCISGAIMICLGLAELFI